MGIINGTPIKEGAPGRLSRKQPTSLWEHGTLVSITLERDGKKTDFYGPNPQGQLMYDANERFFVIITR
jgi:hypothetical protein